MIIRVGPHRRGVRRIWTPQDGPASWRPKQSGGHREEKSLFQGDRCLLPMTGCDPTIFWCIIKFTQSRPITTLIVPKENTLRETARPVSDYRGPVAQPEVDPTLRASTRMCPPVRSRSTWPPARRETRCCPEPRCCSRRLGGG